MATPADVAFIVDAVGPLCTPLHDSFEKAAERAGAHFTEFDLSNEDNGRERTSLTRVHSRKLLKDAEALDGLGGWSVTGCRNGQILLRRDLLRAKVLHTAPGGLVPSPGRNLARISYYRNPPADLFGVGTSRLLAMWSVDVEGQAAIQLVRPTGFWGHGRRHVADIDFALPRQRVDLESMQFEPDDSEIQLPLELSDEETNDDLASGW